MASRLVSIRHFRVAFLFIVVLSGALLAAGTIASSAYATCLTGNMTAQMQTSGPFQGYYKYTLTLSWSTPRGLSHVTFDPGFGLCPEAACAQTWLFEEIAGEGTSTSGCRFDFEGEFNCKGDPSIDYTDPVIKWNAVSSGGCESGQAGTATLRFYTDVPPQAGQTPITLVKNGRNVCEGSITGVFPMACPVPVEPTTWGRIKGLMSRHS